MTAPSSPHRDEFTGGRELAARFVCAHCGAGAGEVYRDSYGALWARCHQIIESTTDGVSDLRLVDNGPALDARPWCKSGPVAVALAPPTAKAFRRLEPGRVRDIRLAMLDTGGMHP